MEARQIPSSGIEFSTSLLEEMRKLVAPKLNLDLLDADTKSLGDADRNKIIFAQKREICLYIAENREYDELCRLLKQILDTAGQSSLTLEILKPLMLFFKEYWTYTPKIEGRGFVGHDMDLTIRPFSRFNQACKIIAQKLCDELDIIAPRKTKYHPYEFLLPPVNLTEKNYAGGKCLLDFKPHELQFDDNGLLFAILPMLMEIRADFENDKRGRRPDSIFASYFGGKKHLALTEHRLLTHSKPVIDYINAFKNVEAFGEEDKLANIEKTQFALIEALKRDDYAGNEITTSYGPQALPLLIGFITRRAKPGIEFAKMLADVEYLEIRRIKLFFSAFSTEGLLKLLIDFSYPRNKLSDSEYELALTKKALEKLGQITASKPQGLTTIQMAVYGMCLLVIYKRCREAQGDYNTSTAKYTGAMLGAIAAKKDKEVLTEVFWCYLTAVAEMKVNPTTGKPYHLSGEDLKTYLNQEKNSKDYELDVEKPGTGLGYWSPKSYAAILYSHLAVHSRFFSSELVTLVQLILHSPVVEPALAPSPQVLRSV